MKTYKFDVKNSNYGRALTYLLREFPNPVVDDRNQIIFQDKRFIQIAKANALEQTIKLRFLFSGKARRNILIAGGIKVN